MDDLKRYAHMIKRYMEREERQTAEDTADNPMEPYTDGEWYAIHLYMGENWREDFIELCGNIRDRFTTGEWNGTHGSEIEKLCNEIAERDKPILLQALAIDAFLANATEEEIMDFNRKARYAHNHTEPEGDALKKRGFSGGRYNSFGIFTKDYTERS